MSPMARRPTLSDLPSEILVQIATYLPPEDRACLRLTCRLLRDAADSPLVWRTREFIVSQHVLRRIVQHRWFYRTLHQRRVLKANMGSVGCEKLSTLEKAFRCLSSLQHITIQGTSVPSFLGVFNQAREAGENGLLEKLDWLTLQFANHSQADDEKIIQTFLEGFPNVKKITKLSLYHVHVRGSQLFDQPSPGYLSGTFLGSVCGLSALTSLAISVHTPYPNGAHMNGVASPSHASCNNMLLYILRHLPNLEKLWILGSPLVLDADFLPEEAKQITDTLSGLRLHTLKLDIGATCPPECSPWMKLFCHLRALSVRFGWAVSDPSGILAQAAPHLTNLHILNIVCEGRPGEQCPFDFSVIPPGIHTLRLSFSAGSCLRRSSLGVLHTLSTTTCSHIQHLHLLQAKLMQVDFDRIANQFTSLKTLHCSIHNESDPEGLMVLQHCKSLTRLSLWYALKQKVDPVVNCLRRETGNRIVTDYIVNYEEPVFKL